MGKERKVGGRERRGREGGEGRKREKGRKLW